jgi:hypothetical protein
MFHQPIFHTSRKGLARIRLDGRLGKIDKTGSEIVPPKYDEIYDFYDYEDLAEVRVGDENTGKWGLFDKKLGKEVLPCQYDEIYDCSEGMAKVFIGERVPYDDYIPEDCYLVGEWGIISIEP